MPYIDSFLNRISWDNVSKALERSRKMPRVNSLFSIASVIREVISIMACSVDLPWIKPYCPQKDFVFEKEIGQTFGYYFLEYF